MVLSCFDALVVVVNFEITKIVASEIIGLIRGLVSLAVLILLYVYGICSSNIKTSCTVFYHRNSLAPDIRPRHTCMSNEGHTSVD